MSRDLPNDAPKFVKVPPLFSAKIHEILRELASHSDREAAIVGLALVEEAVRQVVRANLVVDVHEKIFEPVQLLGSFGMLVKIAESFGFIERELAADLRSLGKIRNNFAHSVASITFETPGLRPDTKSTCEALCLPESYHKLLQRRADGSANTEVRSDDRPEPKLVLLDSFGAVLASYTFDDDETNTPKGRYLITCGLAWILLGSLVLSRRPDLVNEMIGASLYTHA